MEHTKIRGIWRSLLAFAAAAAMLTVIQAPFELGWLGWVALVPFVLVCSPAAKLNELAIAAYIVGLIYWLGNLYWLGFVTVAGWFTFCLYLGLYWPVLALSLRYCRTKNMPLFLAAPVLFVGAEALQGYLLTGFGWRFLAHSQYRNIALLQIADIFGAGGVSFLIAMVNGLLADLIIALRTKTLAKAGNILKVAIVLVAVVSAIIYGKWRLHQFERVTQHGPMVAAVQSNVPLEVKESGQARETIFMELLKDSVSAAGAGAELIVWPETMVQAVLDKRFLELCGQSHHAAVFDKVLSQHSKSTAYVLVGAHGGVPEVNDRTVRMVEFYNSAFLYGPNGQQDSRRYDKIHLVPFGEFVPFKKSIPFLYKFLMRLTPYDYDYNLTAGKEYTIFEIAGHNNKKYRFGVMICYEDTVPVIARKFVLGGPNKSIFSRFFGTGNDEKRVELLVNISNDGWFVRFKDDKVLPSTELAQHTAICVFRAVENRIPVLRSVNTGISCIIDSSGRLADELVAGTLPAAVMARRGIAGWLVDRITLDKRVSFFSRYGRWLDFLCAVCFLTLIILPAWQLLRKNASVKDQ